MQSGSLAMAAVSMLIPAMLLAQPAGEKSLVGVWAVKAPREAKDWLVQIQADDDEGAIRRISDFLDQR